MRQRRCTCDPSSRFACQDATVYSSGRSEEKESSSAINVSWVTSRGAPRESNGLAGLKAFPDEGERRATGIEHRVVQEGSGRILISDRWRSGIGALLDGCPGHTANCAIVRTVNGGRVSVISRNYPY